MLAPEFEDRLRSLEVTAAGHVDESVVVLVAFGRVHIQRRESDIARIEAPPSKDTFSVVGLAPDLRAFLVRNQNLRVCEAHPSGWKNLKEQQYPVRARETIC